VRPKRAPRDAPAERTAAQGAAAAPPPAAAELPALRIPRALRLRLTVAIPLVVTGLVVLSGYLALWVAHPLFFAWTQTPSASELELRVTWAVAAVLGFGFLSLVVAVALAGSIARPLRRLTSQLDSLRPPRAKTPKPPAGDTELAALGTALAGVASSVADLVFDSYTLHSIESGVMTLDQACVVTSVNPVAAEILGIAAGEAVGRRLVDLLPAGRSNEAFLGTVRRALDGGRYASSAEAVVCTPGGRAVQVGYTLSPLRDERAQALGLVLTFKDLAERKVAEQLMQRTENLATLGCIAAGLVHQVRTPLGAIRGYAEMVKDDLPPDAESQQYTAQIIAAVDRLDHLVRDLRTISNPEPRAVEPQDLGRLAHAALALCRGDASAREVEVREDYADDLPPVPVDGEAVTQALLNLLRNAFEAVEPGGHVAVRAWQHDGTVALAVHNTGSYIPPDQQEKLFEPFYTTKRQGTGLGLLIAHQLIRAHGGRIALASTPDDGTTFTVELPLARSHTAPEG